MAEKKIKGRKRHIVTDTQGNLLHVNVHAANIHDTIAGPDVLAEAFKKHPTIQGVSADAGYRGTTVNFITSVGKTVAIALNLAHTWTILKKRWVVERTFSWLNGSRRLSKDYEISLSASANFVRISHIFTLISRMA
jgi:putative transposase